MIIGGKRAAAVGNAIAKSRAGRSAVGALCAVVAVGSLFATAVPAAAQWDSLLNNGVRILQQQRELEFRREQEERRRQEEERRRQEELRRQEQYRQSQPSYSPPASSGAPARTAQPSPGPDPSLVAEIQRRLNEHGYDAGPVDGMMGSRTRDAIRDYERDQGLRPTGEPSRAIAQRLERGPAPTPSPPPSTPAAPTGPESTDVAEIQRLLNERGYDAGPVDGVMGARTRDAIRTYQIEQGMAGTGEPTAEVAQSLRRDAGSFAQTRQDIFGDGSGAAPDSTAPQPAEAPPGVTTVKGRVVLLGGRRPSDAEVDRDALRRMTARLVASSLPEINDQAGGQLLDLMQLLPASERRSLYLEALENRDRPVPRSMWGAGTLFEQLGKQDWYASPESLPRYGVTPFEEDRLVDVFRRRGLPDVVAQAPKLPIPVVVLCEATLGNYDQRKQAFDLSQQFRGCDLKQVESLARYVVLSADLRTDAVRPEFSIEPGEAERLFLSLPARHSGETRSVVLAIEAQLENLRGEVAYGRQTGVLQFRTTGAALYADSTLDREIHRFPTTSRPATTGVRPPEDPAAIANAEALGRQQGKPLVSGRVLLASNAYTLRERSFDLSTPVMWRVLSDTPDLQRGREFQLLDLLDERDRAGLLRTEVVDNVDQRRQKSALDFLAKNGWSYQRSQGLLANYGFSEFDEARLRQRLQADVLPGAVEAGSLRTPLPVLVACSLRLGEYSLQNQGFAFPNPPSYCANIQMTSANGLVRIEGRIDLSGVPGILAMPMEQAERFVESLEDKQGGSSGREREIFLGIEANLTGISARTEGDRVNAQLAFDVTGAAFYRDADRWELIRRLDLDAALPDPADQAPQSVALDDGDTLTLLMLRDGLLEPDEQVWRTMMQVQANRQGNNRSVPSWNLYPQSLDQGADKAAFAEWMRKRAAALPETMTLEQRNFVEPESLRAGGLAVLVSASQYSHQVQGVAGALGVRPDFLFAQSVSGRYWAPDGGRIFVLALPAPKDAYVVPLPGQPKSSRTPVTTELTFRVGKGRSVTIDGDRQVLVAEAVPLRARVSVDGQASERTFSAPAQADASRELDRIPFPNTEWLRLEQARLGGKGTEAGMLEALGRTSFGRSLDEFAIREHAAKLLERARNGAPPSPSDTIWTVGQLKLDTYDFAGERFPVSSLNLSAVPVPPGELEEQLAKQIGFEVENAEELSVAMPADRAKAWMNANSRHPYYPVRAKVRLLGAGRSANLRVKAIEVDLLTEDAIASLDDPHAVVHEILLEAPAETAAPSPSASDAPGAGSATAAPAEVVEVEPGQLDILELRVGAPFDEAVAKAEASIPSPVRADIELPELDRKPTRAWSAFRTVTSVRSADGSQIIVLHRAPPMVASRVTGLARVVTFGSDRLFPVTSVKELLTDKYGEPQEASKNYLVWLPGMAQGGASEREIRACVGAMHGRTMHIIVSAPLDTTSEVPLKLLHTIFGDANGMAATPECGEMLVAVLATDREDRVRQLITVLGSPATNAGIESAGQSAEAAAEEAEKKAAPKLKL